MSSLGLPSRTGASLAYSGWWITGAIFWLLEREDPVVRFHAAQSIVVFGITALLVVVFGMLAAASLSFLPSLFGFFVGAAVRRGSEASSCGDGDVEDRERRRVANTRRRAVGRTPERVTRYILATRTGLISPLACENCH